jgi:phosphotransferase system enzyme I (PtsI)
VPPELTALLDVHLMLLQDEVITAGVRQWITERHYNAEWALVSQLEVLTRQFDEMEDAYLRERKADLEQVVERVPRRLEGEALVLVAHDLSPADMLQFKKSVFAGFVTDLGGKTSHTAIVARSMDIPAVVGARGQRPGAPGRLGHHRRRRRRDSSTLAHHPRRIRLPQRQAELERGAWRA